MNSYCITRVIYKYQLLISHYSTIIMTIAFLLSIWTKFLKLLLTKIYFGQQSTKQIGFGWSCLLIILMANPAVATLNEIAYDCATGTQSVTTLDIATCPPFQNTYTEAPKATIQVLQKTTNTLIQSYSCRAILNRETCRW